MDDSDEALEPLEPLEPLKIPEDIEIKIIQAEDIYNRLKFYCELNGLNFLNSSNTLIDLIELIS